MSTTLLAGLVLGAHLATWHSADLPCSTNPGLYLAAPNGVTVGLYRNSYCGPSGYAAYTWRSQGGTFSLTAGGVTGYVQGRVLPLLVPAVRVPLTDRSGLRLSYLRTPPRGHFTAHAVHVSIECTPFH